jgi:hypothetical protein
LELTSIDSSFNSDYTDLISSNLLSSNQTNSIDLNNTNTTMYEIYYKGSNNLNENIFESFSMESSKNYFNSYYDFLQLDETSDADSNARHNLTTQPFRLMRGVLNQHVVDILQNEKFSDIQLTKLLLLNTKFNQSGEMLKDKELMPETL